MTIIARYGELFLKGGNQGMFEKQLLRNILVKLPQAKVKKSRGRVFLECEDEERLRQVFGITSYSPCVKVEPNLERIKTAAVKLLQRKQGTFRVETTRSDKRFPLTSPEINKEVGQYLEQHTSLRFSLKNPDTVLEIEINQEGAFLFTERVACFGGVPTGVEGTVMVLVEDEASILAGILMMKRGCYILPVAFAEKDISLLQKYSPKRLELKVVRDFLEIEKLAVEKNIGVLVSGQQWDNFCKVETGLIVLRPLVGHSLEEIKKELEKFSAIAY